MILINKSQKIWCEKVTEKGRLLRVVKASLLIRKKLSKIE